MGGGGGGGAEGKLLSQILFLPPQNKYHLATPFPVLKARAPPKIMRARRGLLIQRMLLYKNFYYLPLQIKSLDRTLAMDLFCLQLVWSKDIHDRITRDELAKSVPEAECLLELHQERKVREYCNTMYVCIYICT